MRISIKHLLQTVTAVIITLALVGCEAEKTTSDKLKDLDFTVVGEAEQPDALKDIIAEKSKVHFRLAIPLGKNYT